MSGIMLSLVLVGEVSAVLFFISLVSRYWLTSSLSGLFIIIEGLLEKGWNLAVNDSMALSVILLST